MQNNIDNLPVDPFPIAEKNSWSILTYSQFSTIIGKNVSYLTVNYDSNGFVFFSNKKQTFVICYNPAFSTDIVRWTLIHEMAHIYLGHVSNKSPLIKRGDIYGHLF